VNWPAECAAVVPCLNEAQSIGALIHAIQAHVPTVIVVDDGSTDHTADLASAAGADVVRRSTPSGKGAALRDGWERARRRGFSWVIMLDGDGQHGPSDIPRFFASAERTGATLVIGNRMHSPARMPFVRRVVNQWMSRRLSRLAGLNLPDSQCGFRLARLDLLAALPLHADHFETESEQVLAFVAAGQRVEFVDIPVIYRSERSKIHPLRDTLRWFRWLRQWQAASGRSK